MRVNRPHADSEGFVAALSHRTPSLTPRIEPARAWGGSGHPGHRGDAVLGLIRSHEPVDLPGPTSRANQAVAFASICLPSADKKIAIPVLHADDGSHDAAGASPRVLRCLSPSPRRPSSRSACATQWRSAWAVGSNCLPSADNNTAIHEPALPQSVRCEPVRPSGAGRPAGTAVSISAWWIPPPQRVRGPRNRGNSNRTLR